MKKTRFPTLFVLVLVLALAWPQGALASAPAVKPPPTICTMTVPEDSSTGSAVMGWMQKWTCSRYYSTNFIFVPAPLAVLSPAMSATYPVLAVIKDAAGREVYKVFAVAAIGGLSAGTTTYVYQNNVMNKLVAAPALPSAPTLPPFDPNASWVEHARISRGMKTNLSIAVAYDVLKASPLEVYYSPIGGSVIVIANSHDPKVGLIAGIFHAGPYLTMGKGAVFGAPITVIFNYGRGDLTVHQVRTSSCASFQIWKMAGYNMGYEPPPLGGGKCLEYGNVH